MPEALHLCVYCLQPHRCIDEMVTFVGEFVLQTATAGVPFASPLTVQLGPLKQAWLPDEAPVCFLVAWMADRWPVQFIAVNCFTMTVLLNCGPAAVTRSAVGLLDGTSLASTFLSRIWVSSLHHHRQAWKKPSAAVVPPLWLVNACDSTCVRYGNVLVGRGRGRCWQHVAACTTLSCFCTHAHTANINACLIRVVFVESGMSQE